MMNSAAQCQPPRFNHMFHCLVILLSQLFSIVSCVYNWTDLVYDLALKHSANPIEYLCASSLAVDTPNTGILSYPVDIFSHRSYNHSVSHQLLVNDHNNPFKLRKTYNCSSLEEPMAFHQCTISGQICPIAPENIVSALRVFDWKVRPNICRLAYGKVNRYSRASRIYVLGGSVTIGRYTQGCCCNNITDASCPPHGTRQPCYPYGPRISDDDVQCGWVDFFKSFVKRMYPSIQVINLARPGRII